MVIKIKQAILLGKLLELLNTSSLPVREIAEVLDQAKNKILDNETE